MGMTEYTQDETVAYLEGKQEGVRLERERIIALLEAEIETPADIDAPDSFDPVDWFDGWVTGVRDAVALIKGENE